MGEIADAMLSGLFCEECGGYVDGEEPGYPRLCKPCGYSGRGMDRTAQQKEIERIAKSRKARKRKRAKDRKELVQQIIRNAQDRVETICPAQADGHGEFVSDLDCRCNRIQALLREVLAEYRMKVNEII